METLFIDLIISNVRNALKIEARKVHNLNPALLYSQNFNFRHFPIETTGENELGISKYKFPNLMEVVAITRRSYCSF